MVRCVPHSIGAALPNVSTSIKRRDFVLASERSISRLLQPTTCFSPHLIIMSGPSLQNNIRKLRFERNMTQEELALRTGVSRQTIMSIERGQTNPSVLLAYKISAALDTNVTEVFQMEGALAPV